MVEVGNKAGDWTPAPEDVQSSIDTKANSTDVYVKTEVYTKAQTDAAIKIAKDEINLSVSGTYETKTNVETKISSSKTEAINTSKSYADTKKAEAISTASTDATNKVNSAKTELNTAINKKANVTDVYKKTETYTKSETDSKIKVAKDEITLGVSNAYETKTNVESKISTAVNNVTVGGENILRNSDFSRVVTQTNIGWDNSKNGTTLATGWDCYNKGVVNPSTGYHAHLFQKDGVWVARYVNESDKRWKAFSQWLDTSVRQKIVGGEQYTFSADVYSENAGCYIHGGLYSCKKGESTASFHSGQYQLTPTTLNKWVRMSWTFTVHSDIDVSKNIGLYIYGYQGAVGTLYMKNPQLQRGNKATAWNQSPEDIKANLDTKANSSDVYKKTETYTKSETDSKIKVAKDEINLSVSNTYETKASVTSKINGVNSSISSLTSRVASAESKITDTAITNTVKKNFYTKEETNNQITSKGYATSSEVKQTSDSLIAKFSASGGYNLIRNSGFLKDFNFWGTQTHNNPTGGSISSINSTGDWGFPNARINTAVIRLSNQSNIEYGLKCAVDTTINKLYTIRFRYAAHRVNEVNVIVRNGGGGWHTNKYIKTPYTYSGGKGSEANWGTFTHTFRANSTSHILNFVITNAANDGYFWIAEPMVFEGEIDSPYSPHPSEVYWGQTLIDQNGIRVNASNVKTYTEMHADGFFVKNNDGTKLFEATDSIRLYAANNVSAFEVVRTPDATYGNAMVNIRGGINFLHKPGQSTGTNGIQLGNHDVSNQYGMHNLSIRCWNSLGFSDNNNLTNMFFDVRRGRIIMKGALYQNTATPPSTFSMNFEGEDEVYNSGYRRELAVESVLNLKTGVYVDNDGECCSAIYGGFSELITTEYKGEYGEVTTHLNHEALNASLVVTCQEQQKLIIELRKELDEIKQHVGAV